LIHGRFFFSQRLTFQRFINLFRVSCHGTVVLRQAVSTMESLFKKMLLIQEKDNHREKFADLMFDEELVVGFLPSKVAK
jgi:hypothetical protein